jgi:hypothetical protein
MDFIKQESAMGFQTRITTALVLSSLMLILASAWAQDQNSDPKQSPELQVLQRFIGSWEETVEQKRAAWTPEPSTKKIASTRKWILDGKMIENRGTWSPDDVEFLHLMSYDPKRREYRQWYFESINPISLGEQRGQWDQATQTLTWKGKLDDGVTTETVERFIDTDNFTWTLVAKDSSGQVVLDMEAKVRRKDR